MSLTPREMSILNFTNLILEKLCDENEDKIMTIKSILPFDVTIYTQAFQTTASTVNDVKYISIYTRTQFSKRQKVYTQSSIFEVKNILFRGSSVETAYPDHNYSVKLLFLSGPSDKIINKKFYTRVQYLQVDNELITI